MTYTYDTLGRRTGMSLMQGNNAVQNTSYTYDNLSRLATVGNGTLTATYTRDPGRNRLASTSIANSAGEIMNVTRQYDAYDRLTSIGSTAGSTTRSYTYTYNDRDQRINCTLADGSSWTYAFDDKGQVTGGVRKDAQGKAIPGQSFGYGYDDIGNRLTETRGMAEMLFNYTANNLNQYTQRTVPGIVPIAGSAATDATVRVRKAGTNDVFATVRDGKYYSAAIPVDNTVAGVETDLEVHAVKFDQVQDKDIVKTLTGKYFVDKTPQPFTYDFDGNLLTDGKWSYAWDAENRLLSVTSSTQKIECAYDYQSRRIEKKVYTGASGNWTLSKTEKYVYDAWNCIALFDGSNVLQRNYFWGEDLSGSLQGAGGVGGLLADTSSAGSYIPAYDGNGNIMVYINTADKTIVAEYTYDPFGRTLTATGDLKDSFAYRFSTKSLDVEVGLYYYGYRYYSVEQGRWLSRDPMGEKGGINIYVMLGNNSVSKIDYLGLAGCHCGKDITGTLDRLMSNLTSAINGNSKFKNNVCRMKNLYDSSFGWDIVELFTAGLKNGDNTFKCKGTTSSECEKTVMISGKCYKVWAVNYLLWGKIHKLCGIGIGFATDAVGAYRLFGKKDDSENESWRTGTDSRMNWTAAGFFDNYLSENEIGGNYSCKACKDGSYRGKLTVRLRYSETEHLFINSDKNDSGTVSVTPGLKPNRL